MIEKRNTSEASNVRETFDSKNYSILLVLIWALTYWASFSSVSTNFSPLGKRIAVPISMQQKSWREKIYLLCICRKSACQLIVQSVYIIIIVIKKSSQKSESLWDRFFYFTFVLIVFYLLWTIQWLFYESFSLSKEDRRKDEKTEIDTPAHDTERVGGADEWMKMRKRQK